MAHYNLGIALGNKGELDEAIASYKTAIELDPKLRPRPRQPRLRAEDQGQMNAAVACFKKATELDPKLAPARTGLAEAERLAAAQEKLPAFLKGEFKPTTNEERLDLSHLCEIKKLYHTSAGLYADAFAVDPKLADDLQAGYRYNAAYCAALAAAGQGEDPPRRTTLDETEKARLRKQALDWLRADLALWTRLNDSGHAADRANLQLYLKHCAAGHRPGRHPRRGGAGETAG